MLPSLQNNKNEANPSEKQCLSSNTRHKTWEKQEVSLGKNTEYRGSQGKQFFLFFLFFFFLKQEISYWMWVRLSDCVAELIFSWLLLVSWD